MDRITVGDSTLPVMPVSPASSASFLSVEGNRTSTPIAVALSVVFLTVAPATATARDSQRCVAAAARHEEQADPAESKNFELARRNLLSLREAHLRWTDTDVDAPKPLLVDRALEWLATAARVVSLDDLGPPHVGSGAHGEIILEWWGAGERHLAVYVDDGVLTALSQDGSNVLHEAEAAEMETPLTIRRLFADLTDAVA
jgi:hypothetical protein